MKLRAHVEGLAIPATVATVEAKDTLVKITADRTVGKADAGAHSIGRLVVPSKTVNGLGTVETRYKELIEIKGAAVMTAGQFFQFGAPDGTTGENTAAVWTAGTHPESAKAGIIWKGGAAGATLEALTL